ncbi:MAG: hypothetical protein ACR2L2_12520 [Acidobacteriota bacterium]
MALELLATTETADGVDLLYRHDDQELVVRLSEEIHRALTPEQWAMLAQFAIGTRIRERKQSHEQEPSRARKQAGMPRVEAIIIANKDEERLFRQKVLSHAR